MKPERIIIRKVGIKIGKNITLYLRFAISRQENKMFMRSALLLTRTKRGTIECVLDIESMNIEPPYYTTLGNLVVSNRKFRL